MSPPCCRRWGAQLGFALLFAALAVWRFRKMEGVIEANGLKSLWPMAAMTGSSGGS
jgi:hypothetical protein